MVAFLYRSYVFGEMGAEILRSDFRLTGSQILLDAGVCDVMSVVSRGSWPSRNDHGLDNYTCERTIQMQIYMAL